jgi:hypothetical protein
MVYAKYYNVTNKLNNLLEKGKLFSYTRDYCKGLFICADTHDIWISRILEGYNSEFEQEEGKWLVERNKIDKYDFCEFLKEKNNDDSEITDRRTRDYYINECFPVDEIIDNIILMDDDNGLEGWNNCECNSYDEAIEIIDGGFGIIELT